MKEESSSDVKNNPTHTPFPPKATAPKHSGQHANPLTDLLTPSVEKTPENDTLIDIHVGNPLRRITQLLEEIKKQKAFTFTLKGSLGIMGVALALSLFGVFGGAKMLCDKGMQTHVGTIQVLDTNDEEHSTIPIIGIVVDWYDYFFRVTRRPKKRAILVKDDHSTVHLTYSQEVNYKMYDNEYVYTTGQYDACSQTLKPSTQTDIEVFQ